MVQPGQPALQPVVARIEAVEVEPELRDGYRWDSAVWVKTFTPVSKSQDIDLGKLLIGHHGDADLNGKADEVEMRSTLLQDHKNDKLIGNFLGRQIAGFNADPVLPALSPVPEAQTWAMLLAGLLGVGFMARRRQA